MKRFNSKNDLKNFLDEMYTKYNTESFIEKDPIQIPHKFNLREDIEISAFLTSIISWGNRKMIINNANKMMSIMGNTPYDFIINANEKQIDRISFVHRTFNSDDLKFFIYSLKNIYLKEGGLESVFSKYNDSNNFKNIEHFRSIFFSLKHEKRVEKHISSPNKGSSCKRLHMFLRWMVRNDKIVDFEHHFWNPST